MNSERICEQCSKHFTAPAWKIRLGVARFCSYACSSGSRKKRITITCDYCKSTFQIRPSRRMGEGRYCSRDCRIRALTTARTRSCVYCGATFQAKASGPTKYCSRSCYDASISAKKLRRICPQCGVVFATADCFVNRGNGIYCSKNCSGAAHSGPENPAWNGGTSFSPYPHTFNQRFKRMIRERDKYTCAVCGVWGNSVHHIDYDKSNTTSGNCITLCRPCHQRTNFRRAYWRTLLQGRVS